MGRLDPDMGNAQVVAPGTADDPFTSPSAQTQPPASAPAGPEAAPAGQPGEATPSPDQTPAPTPDPAANAAPAAPPAPPPAQTPAAPGPPPTTETVDPPATPAPAAPMTAEDVERARQEAVDEVDAKWRNRQSGQDRQMNEMQRRLDASEAATEEQRQLTRESLLNKEGLTDAEKASLQRTWDQDDRERKLNEYSASTLDLHADTEIALLLIDYRGIPGITAEALEGLAQEEREGFCKDQKIAHLESGGASTAQPAAATNGAAQPAPAPAATPPPAAPAGVSAPSDVGGAGPPPTAAPRNENPGPDAMAENIERRGWQERTFPSRPGRS